MKGKKHSPDQIIAKLREADGILASGATIAHVCQKLEISEQTFHRWRNQYGCPSGIFRPHCWHRSYGFRALRSSRLR
jgi:transposase-like protein